MYLQVFDTGTVMADAFEYFLNVFHEAVVVDWLCEANVSEVTLTLSRLAAGLTHLIRSGDSEAQIVGCLVKERIPPVAGFAPFAS